MATAMSKAAPLKPEIKLSQALMEFKLILLEDQRIGETAPPEPKDVTALTMEIDRIVRFHK